MRVVVATVVGVILLSMVPIHVSAQATTESVEPFAVGTFGIEGEETLGLVLRNELIVELGPANTHLQEMDHRISPLPMPGDMLGLIEQYEYGLKWRLYEIVNHLVESGDLEGERPHFIHDVEDVDIRAPIQYPGKMLNAAANFFSHACEGCTPEEQAESDRQRRENRGVPYLFYKSTRGAIIGNDDAVVLPYGRTMVDWEVELATVIGRPARYVSANEAEDYVFGYTIQNDISDRGGRPPGGFGEALDWFVGKGHDTFAPMGPWIVPKEFYGNPNEILNMRLTIDGTLVQEAKAVDIIHNIWELIEYGSSINTLHPGDVINSGTTGGTSTGAFAEGTRSGYLQPGEVMVAEIEGIGTLRSPVEAGLPLPDDLTDSFLPAVETYQDTTQGRQ